MPSMSSLLVGMDSNIDSGNGSDMSVDMDIRTADMIGSLGN